MKRIDKKNKSLRKENLADTLEFISLDDISSDDSILEDTDEDMDIRAYDNAYSDEYDDIDSEAYDDVENEGYDDIENEDYDDINSEAYNDIEDDDLEDISEEIYGVEEDGSYDEIEDGEYDEIDYDDEDYDEIEDEAYDDEYDEIDYEDEDYEDIPTGKKPRRKGLIFRIAYWAADMSAVDRVVAIFGFFIIIVAAVTGTLYVNAKTTSKQVEAFAEIGNDIEGIGLIGESGLIAVSDAESARLSQMLNTEPETEEGEKGETIEVGMNITSIQSDIKVKFVKKENNKLIANVPFEVEISGSKGKTFSLKDEDEDGIIYQTNVDADTYTVIASVPEGEEFEKYAFSSQSETIDVTDTIAYKKVDIADEIKSESEVNAAAEDTAKHAEVESTLTDTVEWVESTKTEIESDENYEEIKKGDIPDPSTLSKAAGFMKLAESTENNESDDSNDKPKTDKEKLEALNPVLTPTSVSINKGESVSLILTTSTNLSYNLDWSTSNTDVAIVENSGTVTGVSKGSATITVLVTLEGSSESVALKCSVTVTEDTASESTVTYKMKSVTGGGNIKVGETCTVSGTTEPEGGMIKWSSSNAKVATVDDSGRVTGISTGTISIIGTSESGDSKECSVTVEQADVTYKSVTITGDSTVQVGKTVVLKAVTEPEGGSVSWTSDNEKIVKIDNSGNMTGVSAGTATITATCGSIKSTLNVTVTQENNVSSDTKSKLKDKNGNQVYIKSSDGKYSEATYADYYKSSKFYLKSVNVKYRYTGWQTIDGYTYFFDKNGNYVTGEQVIQGARYVFGSDGRLSSSSGAMGIDVSKWNGSIDWNAVKNSGVSYVIIRCGYRGSSTGALIEDPKFVSNIKGAKAAGLKVGVYFFSQAVNEVEAVEEASMVINLVKGYGLNYPVFLDVEASGGRGDSISAATRTAVCKAFCATIQNSGYSAGIYANKTWLTSYINTASLTGYKIWLAQYAASPSYTATRYDMWQYSSQGKVSGISGNVDMNISYMAY